MKYYSAIKRNEVLHATTWMNLKNFMPSERCQHQRTHVTRFHPYKIYRLGESIETEGRLVVLRGYRVIEQ